MTTEPADNDVLPVYERHGRVWAGLRSAQAVEHDWIDRFCALIPAGATILDIGCGSGVPIARMLVERGYDVTGVDGSATMLALFRANLPGVAAQRMDMRQLALGQRFAGLLAWDSFFHLSPEDQRGMFARFRAHAAPGAPLMFTSGGAEGSAIGDLAGDPLYHGSLGPAEYRERLNAAGFDLVDHVVNDPASDRTVWLARQRD
ncbi:class I SAM-dependent methyltransferase [Sphingomonas sp.]|uniref:class I SAM-dependent methyltransferase n=1 Tax=Sphingomonas sp. TaxID=28214 RepID=UPI003B3B3AC7